MGEKEAFNAFYVVSGELLFKCQCTEMQHGLKGGERERRVKRGTEGEVA